MLIDNKLDYSSTGGLLGNGMKTVADFVRKYTGIDSGRSGSFDIVTGFFSMAGLELLYRELSDKNEYRLILSELTGDDDFMSRVINLLQGDAGIESSLKLSQCAKNAIEFLKRETVQVRAVTNVFCHAKAYIYKDVADDTHDYYMIGSSNLTESGMGIHESSNIELNFAQTGSTNSDYTQLRHWFETQWKTVAQAKVCLNVKGLKSEVDVKQYFIRCIEECFGRVHTPEEIYYKILFELFNGELDIEDPFENQKEMVLLKDSAIYQTLFDYQKKGIVSLIKMLKKWNGAILADAVGLGKTFSALAVMKYFQNNGYQVLMLCPKKLEQNWKQYRRKQGSRFDRDEFDYVVRFHTDLQHDRMEKGGEVRLSWLLKQPKLLVVVDESHNLRSDTSRRYKTLLQDILAKDATDKVRDVKVLLLSATPINNGLTDIRNQFKLIAQGDNAAFNTEDFQVENLETLFRSANTRFREWCEKPNRTIGEFIENLPPHFFDLTDRLIVARTRHMIEKTLGEDLGFPEKAKPVNEYVGLNGIGDYPDVAAIYDALLKTNLTAYQPTQYMAPLEATGGKGWQDDTYREKSLVKMMAILFMKRLESCWCSCMKTIEKVLTAHKQTLDKVNAFLEWRDAHGDTEAWNGEDTGDEITISVPDGEEADDEGEDEAFTLRDATISLAKMARIQDFRKGLEADVQALSAFYNNLAAFEAKFKAGEIKDNKLSCLLEILEAKQSEANRKALVFTTFGDTAEYLYEQIRKVHPEWRIACITGPSVMTSEMCDSKKGQTAFQGVLQRFAPRAKLYHEFDWSDLYADAGLRETCYDGETKKWNVSYEQWREAVGIFDPDTQKVLDAEIDILIATDCLSEGQNLQDSDLVINYDIHWNPVRLIQRFGRIDRIGSANKVVKAVNFWPTKSYNDYLHLTGRINNRMALMRLAGTETQPTDEELATIVKKDPTIDHNTQKLLDQIANADISEIEENGAEGAGSGNPGLQNLSLEIFRQDLQDFFAKHRDLFLQMPHGVFSGFKLATDTFADMPESLVAVLGYPRRKAGDGKKPYEKIYLLCQPVEAHAEGRRDGENDDSVSQEICVKEMNTAAILNFLRKNRGAPTDVPEWILTNDKERLAKLSTTLKNWIEAKAPVEAEADAGDFFDTSVPTNNVKTAAEKIFKPENFDLIAWEYVSR